MSLTPAARRWSAILDDYESSGLSQRAFAKERGINPSTLAAWRSKLGRSSTSRTDRAAFTELVVEESRTAPEVEGPESSSSPVVIRLVDRPAEVVVQDDTDLALLRRVVDALC